MRKILKRINSLRELSGLGAALSTIINFDTSYRYLVCGNYIVFYRVEQEDVYVDRVLYSRRDYVRILFGEIQENEDDTEV